MPLENMFLMMFFSALVGTFSYFFNRTLKGNDDAISELRAKDFELERSILDAREASTARDYLHDLALQRIHFSLATLTKNLESMNEWVRRHEQ